MKHLRLTVTPTGGDIHPTWGALAAAEGVEAHRMVYWNVDREVATLMFEVDGDVDVVRRILGGEPLVRDFEVVPGDGRWSYLYVRGEKTDTEQRLYDAFFRERLLIVPPLSATPDGGVRFAVVGEATALNEALAARPDSVRVDVEGVGEYEGRPRAAADLTARQRETLRAAVETGYYEVPREATVEAVAEAVDLASSTVSEHLRKAEAAVMPSAVD